jgi:ribosomal protein S12 methylthiotransferase
MMLPAELREERRARFMAVAEAVSAAKLQNVLAPRCRFWWIPHPAWARRAVSGAATPMRRKLTAPCGCCRPEKISKTLKVGEFTRARVVGAQGHDLVAVPV